MQRAIRSEGRSSRTPAASSTSALPERPETERLPCFATLAPAPAATSALAVEMLNVPLVSPPVPQVSIRWVFPTSTRVARRRITAAAAAISSTVSPFIRSPTRKPPTWAGVHSPVMMPCMTPVICAPSRSCRSMTARIAAWMSIVIPPFSCPRIGSGASAASPHVSCRALAPARSADYVIGRAARSGIDGRRCKPAPPLTMASAGIPRRRSCRR